MKDTRVQITHEEGWDLEGGNDGRWGESMLERITSGVFIFFRTVARRMRNGERMGKDGISGIWVY